MSTTTAPRTWCRVAYFFLYRHADLISVFHVVMAECFIVRRPWIKFRMTVGVAECHIVKSSAHFSSCWIYFSTSSGCSMVLYVKRPFLFPSCWTCFSISSSRGMVLYCQKTLNSIQGDVFPLMDKFTKTKREKMFLKSPKKHIKKTFGIF